MSTTAIVDFPLRRLSDHYHIHFADVEQTIIQTLNRLFWIIFEDHRNELPPYGFQGTPMELWGLIMIVSVRAVTMTKEIKIIIIPQNVKGEFENILNWRKSLTPNVDSILQKICRMGHTNGSV